MPKEALKVLQHQFLILLDRGFSHEGDIKTAEDLLNDMMVLAKAMRVMGQVAESDEQLADIQDVQKFMKEVTA